MGVPVTFQGYKTTVRPNLPKFTEEDLSSRLSLALKGVLALNLSKAGKPIILTSEDDDDSNDDEEIDILSQSILCSRRPSEKVHER